MTPVELNSAFLKPEIAAAAAAAAAA